MAFLAARTAQILLLLLQKWLPFISRRGISADDDAVYRKEWVCSVSGGLYGVTLFWLTPRCQNHLESGAKLKQKVSQPFLLL